MKHKMLVAAWVALLLSACGGGGGGGADGGTVAQAAADSDLALTASVAEAAVPAGGTATVTITVTNHGPATATGVELAAHWSTGLAAEPNLACTASGGAVCPPAGGSGTVPDIPPSGSLTFTGTAQLKPDARGALTSSVVGIARNDPKPADNFGQLVIQGYQADVSVSGTGPAAPVPAGGATSYTMTVANAGPDDARNVAIHNALDAALVPGAMSCVASGGATCPAALGANMRVALLPRAGSLTFTIPAQVAAGTSGSIADVMTVAAAGDAVAGNDRATVQASAYVAKAPGQTTITLQSDAGDFVGEGLSYTYTKADAALAFTARGGTLKVSVAGDQTWTGEFDLPAALTQFQPGTYPNLTRAAFRDPAVGGLDWSGEGRGCNTVSGSITVNSATYASGALSAIDLSFEQHCEGAAPALHGHVVWTASDTTTPPGPVAPPAGLWAPAPGATPATGSYVYLQSDAGDFIGAGQTFTYTKASALLSTSVSGGVAHVSVGGDQNWTGDFAAMNTVPQLQAGYYGGLQRYPFQNPAKGGLSWYGEGRGCNTLTGWMVVDAITWNTGTLATLDLRFEQHCEGGGPALHGKVHWDASDATPIAGPAAVPAALWAAPAGATPASGNYVYLASDAGDYIGAGQTSVVTTLSTSTGTGHLGVAGAGWYGNFQAMDGLAQLQPGYYGGLQRYPFYNHVKGGLDWSGNGRGCNTLQGWFAVDSVRYDAGGLAAIDLRFEQHCEGAAPALRGQLHWAR